MEKIDVSGVDSIYIDYKKESKEKTNTVRISNRNYEAVRKIAFENHTSINEVLNSIINEKLFDKHQ